MDTNTILIAATLFVALVGVGFTIFGYIKERRIRKKYITFYKSKWIKKKRGLPDYCTDIYGTFLYELLEGIVKKDEIEDKKTPHKK